MHYLLHKSVDDDDDDDDDQLYNESSKLLKFPPKYNDKIHSNPIKELFIIMLSQMFISFSYLSLRSLLAIFLYEIGNYTEEYSAFIINVFVSAYFLFAIFGGVLADMKVGRVPTIICGCILSTIGYYFEYMSISYKRYDENNTNNYRQDNIIYNKEYFLFGLVLISFGGMTIPNISALIGDQWEKSKHLYDPEDMQQLIGRSFRFYYMSINFGAIIGILWLPTLDYFDSFRVITIISALACVIFSIAAKTNSLNIVDVHRSNLLSLVHDYGDIFHHLLIILAPLPLFWALFYNIPSLWTFSAEHMNRHIFNHEISASSVQVLNPLLNLLLIPLFDFIIYPSINKKYKFGPIRRMCIGMLMTSLSLFCAAYIEVHNAANEINVVYMLPQYILLSCGEILLSITCLEFAYSYSPIECKSLVLALSFFTRSLGNLAVALIDLLHIGTPAEDYFMFGTIMLFATIFYARYTNAWSIQE